MVHTALHIEHINYLSKYRYYYRTYDLNFANLPPFTKIKITKAEIYYGHTCADTFLRKKIYRSQFTVICNPSKNMPYDNGSFTLKFHVRLHNMLQYISGGK